jgi:hypothetical protein
MPVLKLVEDRFHNLVKMDKQSFVLALLDEDIGVALLLLLTIVHGIPPP